jgi:hypothetical protein
MCVTPSVEFVAVPEVLDESILKPIDRRKIVILLTQSISQICRPRMDSRQKESDKNDRRIGSLN